MCFLRVKARSLGKRPLGGSENGPENTTFANPIRPTLADPPLLDSHLYVKPSHVDAPKTAKSDLDYFFFAPEALPRGLRRRNLSR